MQYHALSVKLKLCHFLLLTLLQSLCLFPCCSGCPTGGLIGEADTARSSQGHLVSSNWPVWADQPTVHHSVWEDHFHSHHTPQHTFLLTIRHHRPGSGAGVLCKGSRSYTKWKWYLQQLGVSDYLWRWEQLYCMWYSIMDNLNCYIIACMIALHVLGWWLLWIFTHL